MEFTFDVGEVLPGIITVLETTTVNDSSIRVSSLNTDNTQDEKQDTNSWIYHVSANTPWDLKLKKKKENLVAVVDEMGYASAQAQSLRSPITTLKKLVDSVNQKIYILRDSENSKAVIGFLKVGVKRLFVCDQVGAHHEVDPLCILDFYVHESKQRCGFGHELFNRMLQAENVMPEQLAVDRPSLKFLSFLTKHYNLKNPLVQANNFVIYPGFFAGREGNTKNNNWTVSNAAHNKVEGWGSNHSTPCSLPPVNSIPNYSRKKWDPLQSSSSWNILGVKPIDYSVYQKRN